ncbi:glutathione S-transferase N-terminal domain-containing protein [Segnochrobactraceae bacterium EtOH-i3]
MKLFYSPTSPFVRKVSIAALELGLADRIERVPVSAHPINRSEVLVAANPVGKVPTLVTDTGTVLYDSAVILAYLDWLAGTGRLIPVEGIARFEVMRDEALADGLTDAGLLIRYEQTARPEDRQFAPWVDGQLAKMDTCLAGIEARAAAFADRVDVGTIAIACALGWVDFRMPALNWRARAPETAAWYATFSERPSLKATAPVG